MHEREYENIAKVYPEGIHGAIKSFLSTNEDIEVKCVTMNEPNQGLSKELLDETDVLIWWAHALHEDLTDENASMVADYVRYAYLPAAGGISAKMP